MRCPRCKTNNLIQDNGRKKCLSCGHEPRTLEEQRLYINANIAEIVADYLELGIIKCSAKHQIGATSLYKRPEIREVLGKKIIIPEVSASGNGACPAMPEFSNDWATEVQLKWLDIYDKRLEKEKV